MTLTGMALAPLFASWLPQSSLPPYVGEFQLAIEPLVNPQLTAASKTSVTPKPTIDYATQAQVLWSPKAVAPVVRRLQAYYPGLTTEILLRHLAVTHQPGSNRLSVTYRDQDRAKAQAVVQQLAHSYLQLNQADQEGRDRVRQLLDQRLSQLQQQLAAVKQRLHTLQQSAGITDPEPYGNHLTQRLQTLLQQRQQLQIQLAEARTRSQLLQRQLGLDNPALATELLQNNAQSQQLLAQLQQAIVQVHLTLDYPQGNSAALKTLEQRYQHLLNSLTQTAQATALRAVPASRSPASMAPNIRAQTWRQWIAVTQQLQVIHLQQQAIEASEQRVQNLVQQWAVFARESAALQLKQQTIHSQLQVYQQRQTELTHRFNPQLSVQLVASPKTLPISSELSWVGDDLLMPMGMTLSLSLLLLILALIAAKHRHPIAATPSSTEAPPGLNHLPQPQLGFTYYRWLLAKLAVTAIAVWEKPLPTSTFKPIISSLVGASLAATTVSGLAIANPNQPATAPYQATFDHKVVMGNGRVKLIAPKPIEDKTFSKVALMRPLVGVRLQ